jgi:hypothetical protein
VESPPEKCFYPIKSNNYKDIPLKTQETPGLKTLPGKHLDNAGVMPYVHFGIS